MMSEGISEPAADVDPLKLFDGEAEALAALAAMGGGVVGLIDILREIDPPHTDGAFRDLVAMDGLAQAYDVIASIRAFLDEGDRHRAIEGLAILIIATLGVAVDLGIDGDGVANALVAKVIEIRRKDSAPSDA